MRIVLKALWKSVMAILTIAIMAFTLMPATDAESAALGRDANQFNLIQMRLAKTMMTVAPDFAVARYAEATGVPPDMMRSILNAKAAGEPIVPQSNDFYADGQNTSVPAIADNSRRTEAGGALFAKPD